MNVDIDVVADVGDAGMATVQHGYRIVSNVVNVTSTKSEVRTSGSVSEEADGESRFQYILAAPTSILTKPGDPSLTYINQGQSYEIKIKKLGDISGKFRDGLNKVNINLIVFRALQEEMVTKYNTYLFPREETAVHRDRADSRVVKISSQ